jgi:DNA-binding NarL/FixJ family response regulator
MSDATPGSGPGSGTDTEVRVLVVDDHELIRQGLVGAFSREPDMTVVGDAADVTQALKAYEQERPDVVVTDLQLPDGTGLDIIRAIRRESQQAGLVVVTMHSGDEQIFAAMEAGASAFVGKDAPSAEVVKAARHAHVSPRSFLCAGLVGAMMRRASAESTRLSEREHQVLVLLADGLGAGAIAQKLYLSESTAKSHIARIYQKLGANNRAQALVTAMRIGLLSSLPSREIKD